MIDDFNDADDNSIQPSKTQRKREMTELQTMGQKLLQLNAQQLKKLALSEILAEAITLAQRLPKSEGFRRQVQYIGRLMRDLDDETVTRIKRCVEALNLK